LSERREGKEREKEVNEHIQRGDDEDFARYRKEIARSSDIVVVSNHTKSPVGC
jgi:ribosomal protein S25